MEVVPYGGWERCARLISGDVEALVTLEVGPRVIRLGFIGGRNELHEDPLEVGKTGGTDYRSYGGHRLWIAPEDEVRTYQPENSAVETGEENGWAVFRIQPDQFGMQKEIRMRANGGGAFQLDHRIRNCGSEAVEMAPWALTVMAPGGECYIPQPEHLPFPEVLTPVRPLAMWSYLDMTDPRYTWGKRVIQLRHAANAGPTKVGTFVDQGFAGYWNGGSFFVKRFSADVGKSYPDFGCNFESFTRHDMLEHESLGYLRTLAPGEEARHLEAWSLTRCEKPVNEHEAYSLLAEVAKSLSLRD